ncbi:TetR/AcrR family transcriptional regulator [Streptomyces sp. NPDC020141]|uniref:TetR/AcrR family transcriptional regulator n=1 Tax=Streptomyces sp. NPDC020141 TaxID=3365065 RepID=UPI0037AF301D
MTTAKGAARRAALLDAAETTLATGGHTALSLRAVADTAGVRLGHLQYYFPTRDSLVAEVLARILQRSLDRVTEIPSARLDDTVQLLLSQQTDEQLVRVFVELWALAAHDEPTAATLRSFYRQYAALITAHITTHAPDLSPAQRHARAEVFIALMEGSSLLRSGIAGTPSAETDEVLVRVAVGVLRGEPRVGGELGGHRG